jgi:hypothetical protein
VDGETTCYRSVLCGPPRYCRTFRESETKRASSHRCDKIIVIIISNKTDQLVVDVSPPKLHRFTKKYSSSSSCLVAHEVSLAITFMSSCLSICCILVCQSVVQIVGSYDRSFRLQNICLLREVRDSDHLIRHCRRLMPHPPSNRGGLLQTWSRFR